MFVCPVCGSWRFPCECAVVDPDVDDGPITAFVYQCADCGAIAFVHPVTGRVLEIIEEQHETDSNHGDAGR
jgi:DNA-directed RNA polymerase subunit RPC12/RpoP